MNAAAAVSAIALGWVAVLSFLRGRRAARTERLVLASDRSSGDRGRPGWLRGLIPRPVVRRAALLCVAAGGAAVAWLLAGPMGAVIGVAAATGGSRARRHRRDRAHAEKIETQIADLAESTALGLRSGLSVTSALAFAGIEAGPPIRGHLDRFVDEQRLGVPFEVALSRLGQGIGTDDAGFLVLVTGIHARSGGDLVGALDDVSETIRHRIGIRRELRAASAQGRISGVIMGSLPIAFFLFLSITSHDRLAPILRSGPGMAMVAAGLGMEALAYVWIRRLLRVEV
jgi:tight adherence protein B